MTFTLLSSRERSVSIEGRHFFCAGRDCNGWTLFEKEHDIVVAGQTRLIGRKFVQNANEAFGPAPTVWPSTLLELPAAPSNPDPKPALSR